MTPRPFHLVLLSLAVALLAGCGKQTIATTKTPSAASTASVTAGPAAASVNGHPIPMSTYKILYKLDEKHLAGQAGVTKKVISQEALNQAIQNEVVILYASAHQITVTPAEIDAEISSEQAQAGGAQKYQSDLNQAGLTLASYKTLLLPNMLARNIASRLFPLKMQKVEGARVWNILISQHPQHKHARTDAQAKALATTILHEVQAGGDFAGLAHEYSDDSSTAQQGGDLGDIYRGQAEPALDKAIFSARLNHPVLIKLRDGYHVIEVITRGQTERPSRTSQQTQQQQFTAWIQAQVRKAKVKRYVK